MPQPAPPPPPAAQPPTMANPQVAATAARDRARAAAIASGTNPTGPEGLQTPAPVAATLLGGTK